MAPIRDYTGRRFHHLTLLKFSRGRGGGKHALWLARCDCGNIKELSPHEVARGSIKTCGTCQYARDLRSKRAIPGTPLPTAKRQLYRKYVERAVKSNIEWSLTPEVFGEITGRSCTYCGDPPTLTFKKTKLLYNGIDRVLNDKGYTLDNSVACCGTCNKMKWAFKVEEFLIKAFKIAAKHIELRDQLIPPK